MSEVQESPAPVPQPASQPEEPAASQPESADQQSQSKPADKSGIPVKAGKRGKKSRRKDASAQPGAEGESSGSNTPKRKFYPADDENGSQLQSSWTFWFNRNVRTTHKEGSEEEKKKEEEKKEAADPAAAAKPEAGKEAENAEEVNDYEHSLQKIGTFSTIEGFWRYYTHLEKVNQLPKNTNYSLFRGDVKPMWENFLKGGCWNLHIKKKSPALGWMWEQLIFAAIGEIFEEPDVVGVVVSIRSKEDVISIWNKTNQNHSVRFKIGEKLEQILGLSPSATLEYKNHSSSIKDRSTYRNGKLYLVPSN